MANVDPINHDSLSTAATVTNKAVKYGALGALAAVLIPAVLAVATVGLGYAAIAVAGAGTAAAISGAVALGIGAIISGIGAVSSFGFAGAAFAVGGTLGALKGSSQVSKENNAFRSRVVEKMNGRENKEAKLFNDGEVKGLEEGYALATKDMETQIQAREQAAFQHGQEVVVGQIQEQMMKAAAAEQGGQGKGVLAHAKAEHSMETKHADKHPSKTLECKAEAIIKEREAPAGHHQLAV